MGLRPGRCYRSLEQRPFTRIAIKVHDRNYVGTVPPVRIRQFNMGNPGKKYSRIVDLVADSDVQIRDNAIEAARITINRFLIKSIGKDSYFMRIRVFPHQILREHKQAQGAGADRVSQGMSRAFGKPTGRAMRVRKGTVLMSILVMSEHIEIAKKAFLRAKAKFPCKVAVKAHKDIESIGTRPKHAIEEIKEEPEEKPEEEKEEGKEEKGKEGKGKEGKGKEGKGKEEKGKEEKGKSEAKKEESKPEKKK